MNERDYPLSDQQVFQIVGRPCKMVPLDQFEEYLCMDQLLRDTDCVLLLYMDSHENNTKSGHWTCLMKFTDNDLAYFDSFGALPDQPLDNLPMKYRRDWGAVQKFISNMLIGSRYRLHYNPHNYQHDKAQTCGRHAGYYMRLGLDPEEYKKHIDNIKEENGYSDYDNLIIDLTEDLI